MNQTQELHPVFTPDPLIGDAAKRAFNDLASDYFEQIASNSVDPRLPSREPLLSAVGALGFDQALPDLEPGPDWVTAASILSAQAYSAAPIDMAYLLIVRDTVACIAESPLDYPAKCQLPQPANEQEKRGLMLARCLQINAAANAAIDLSLDYVQQRHQFGRPLAKFQAIQHSLAIAAEETAAAKTGADLALSLLSRSSVQTEVLTPYLDAASLLAVGTVKVVYDVTHQVHGAIGFTREYALQRHSLNMLRWRDHLLELIGGDAIAAERLGQRVIDRRGLWLALTDWQTSTSNR